MYIPPSLPHVHVHAHPTRTHTLTHARTHTCHAPDLDILVPKPDSFTAHHELRAQCLNCRTHLQQGDGDEDTSHNVDVPGKPALQSLDAPLREDELIPLALQLQRNTQQPQPEHRSPCPALGRRSSVWDRARHSMWRVCEEAERGPEEKPCMRNNSDSDSVWAPPRASCHLASLTKERLSAPKMN